MLNEKLIFRRATKDDIIGIVNLIWHDDLRQKDSRKPSQNKEEYLEVFTAIEKDANQFLLVVSNDSDKIIGTSHLTRIQYLPFLDARMLVEFVRIHKDYQGQGIGKNMFNYIKKTAEDWGVSRIQLTSDKRREKAYNFYKSIGFADSHEGFKYYLLKR